jgi:hypothetical protein
MKILLFMLLALYLQAHQSSLALLNFEITNKDIKGNYKISIRDAHELINLDDNFDDKITWREVLNQKPFNYPV